MKIITEFSVYELDFANKKIRKVSGTGETTARFAPMGEWKAFTYLCFMPTFYDEGLTVFWDEGGKATMLSEVREILDEDGLGLGMEDFKLLLAGCKP